MIERIHWLGHATFRINGPPHSDGPVIYIDPWRLPPGSPPADLILVSHDHHDHCSPQDIEMIRHDDTVIVANRQAAEIIGPGVHVLEPWRGGLTVGEVFVRAVPAYTVDRAYHAREFGGLGFLISLMRYDIYFAGDTDLIPEMHRIGCDIALLPVGGAFTMNYEEAAEAVKRLRPRYAIPMHYGMEIPGSRDDGRRFCQMVNSGVQAVELPIENEKLRV
ncbi:MAG TPA: MBL fold metallo-hydrolase [Chloroflexi bacterium]|nr:MBL fold metallo-hydrolase [Chloroflexota bacterium]